MRLPDLHRRDFLKGCCAATLAGGASRSYGAFDATTATTQDTLVVVFLRGAMDALSLLSPGQNHPDRANYEANRDNTRVLMPPPHGFCRGSGSRSMMRTRTPARASRNAAVAPAGPAPATMTSES